MNYVVDASEGKTPLSFLLPRENEDEYGREGQRRAFMAMNEVLVMLWSSRQQHCQYVAISLHI